MSDRTRKPCTCDDPLPCVFPVPKEGTECDNCGDWLIEQQGNDAGKKQLERALKRHAPT